MRIEVGDLYDTGINNWMFVIKKINPKTVNILWLTGRYVGQYIKHCYIQDITEYNTKLGKNRLLEILYGADEYMENV